ncbi:hypothetical protein [Clostridium sp. C105KSO13]|uniref:hypothetical protein n=1 Tax=Clostridium sp. C105KSO13 TaxID=1776045 RepID=UPI001FA80DB0|nr:hypothetical protein [Clostridium sp. C105KSO13]
MSSPKCSAFAPIAAMTLVGDHLSMQPLPLFLGQFDFQSSDVILHMFLVSKTHNWKCSERLTKHPSQTDL